MLRQSFPLESDKLVTPFIFSAVFPYSLHFTFTKKTLRVKAFKIVIFQPSSSPPFTPPTLGSKVSGEENVLNLMSSFEFFKLEF